MNNRVRNGSFVALNAKNMIIQCFFIIICDIEVLHIKPIYFNVFSLSNTVASSDGLVFNRRIPVGTNKVYFAVFFLKI